MSDDKIITTSTTSPTPDIGATQENAAVSANRTATIRAKRGSLVPMPGGRRVDAGRHQRARYTMRAEAGVLGDPKAMLSDDWKREHIGWYYQWPIRVSNQTASFIRAGWFVPVPFEALNSDDPMAMVGDIKTPGGKYIVWKSHLLVAVPPDKHDLLVTQYEDYAISRLDNNAEAVAAELSSRNPGYEGEVDAFTNLRQNKTGD